MGGGRRAGGGRAVGGLAEGGGRGAGLAADETGTLKGPVFGPLLSSPGLARRPGWGAFGSSTYLVERRRLQSLSSSCSSLQHRFRHDLASRSHGFPSSTLSDFVPLAADPPVGLHRVLGMLDPRPISQAFEELFGQSRHNYCANSGDHILSRFVRSCPSFDRTWGFGTCSTRSWPDSTTTTGMVRVGHLLGQHVASSRTSAGATR